MKYIIVESFDIPLAILFSEILEHDKVANGRKCLSAGFCNVEGNTWGKSVSLGLSSKIEDKSIILDAINRTI